MTRRRGFSSRVAWVAALSMVLGGSVATAAPPDIADTIREALAHRPDEDGRAAPDLDSDAYGQWRRQSSGTPSWEIRQARACRSFKKGGM